MADLTGVGGNLISTTGTTKYTTTESWKMTRIGGLGRSVTVIDNSHLGINAERSKHYVFADLYDLRPITVELLIDPDDTTVFDTVTDTNLDTGPDHDVPFNLGVTGDFVLTFPTAAATSAAALTFSGAIVDDGGVDMVNNDRLRTTIQIQPDGEDMDWAARV